MQWATSMAFIHKGTSLWWKIKWYSTEQWPANLHNDVIDVIWHHYNSVSMAGLTCRNFVSIVGCKARIIQWSLTQLSRETLIHIIQCFTSYRPYLQFSVVVKSWSQTLCKSSSCPQSPVSLAKTQCQYKCSPTCRNALIIRELALTSKKYWNFNEVCVVLCSRVQW